MRIKKENILEYNLFKVIIGFIGGTILLYFIQDMYFIIVSILQFIFFLCLYTIIDKIHSKVKTKEVKEKK